MIDKKFVQDWYDVGRNIIPDFNSEYFKLFIANSINIVFDINKPKLKGVIPTIELTNQEIIAAADTKNKKVFVGSTVFNKDFYTKNLGDINDDDLKYLALIVTNGSIIHEALHLEHTPSGESLSDIINSMVSGYASLEFRLNEARKKYGENNVLMAFNLIEDLFIEARLNGDLAEWLWGCSNIMFPPSRIEKYAAGEINESATWNLAICYKNKNERTNPAFNKLSPKIINILRKATNYLSPDQRASLAIDLLDAIYSGSTPSETKSQSEKCDGGQDDIDGAGDGSQDDIDRTLTGDLSEIKPTDEDLSEITEKIKEKIDKLYKDGYHKSVYGVIKKPVVLPISKAQKGKYHKPSEFTDFKYIKELAAIRTPKRTIGQARKSGGALVKSRLHRIATDQKIFAKRDSSRKTNKRLEIIILVDMSGSTSSSGIYNNEVGAAISISEALLEARIAHSVYGHTTRDWADPEIYHFWSYDMVENVPMNETQISQVASAELMNNADGLVIAEMPKLFTGKNAQRYLIVLSDGLPESEDYWGEDAKRHTINEIKKVREQGIIVFSISVVGHVVKRNNEVYGKDWNIDGSKQIASQMKELIKKISL